jgi:site-specific DNA recombinase
LSEDVIKRAFLGAFNSLTDNKDEILTSLITVVQVLIDTSELDKKCAKLQSEVEVVTGLLHKCVEENAHYSP